MKALLITICLVFICGCPEAKPLRWYPEDSIGGESYFDMASDAFDEAAEGREVRTWEATVSTQEAIEILKEMVK